MSATTDEEGGDRTRQDGSPPGVILRTLRGHDGFVCRIAWSPDGRTLASGAQDHTVRLWDAETGNLLQTLDEHTNSVYSVAWSPDGRTLASASKDHTVRLWDAKTGNLLQTLDEHTENVYSVAWSPDGRTLASASSDQTVRLWDAGTGRQTRTFEGHTDLVMNVSFYCDGALLASVSWDDTVRLWRVDTGAPLASLDAVHNAGSIWQGLAFHPHLPNVLAALDEKARVIHIWELDLGMLLGREAAVRHTTAKIVLVGDSGVGKTGLGAVIDLRASLRPGLS